ncbi:phytoene desaturase family protein [Sediminicola luteus]|uniref:Phytoene dehydrogenase n=1 Tax=Sediminicola luteus TaxID=319238 RepID=A0A2A4G242_9FLAO|nr:phytoene desaturase family protein [Sediminicola luteus]PCE63049.1 phytoene dehydrogenase [Sediminicola luteus]
MKKKVALIGSGFSSLAASAYLAKAGFEVTVFEKNTSIGGRASVFRKDGFMFDMGPTWYWMPDVFEKFFADFDRKPSDYYVLERLDPAYKVYFGKDEDLTISGYLDQILALFEKEEPGSAAHLERFLKMARKNYGIAVEKMVYLPGKSPLELVNGQTITRVNQFFGTIRTQVRKRIKNKKLVQLLEFPILFLGAKPDNTPGFYNFMNWADFGLGTWHPKGGMSEVISAMTALAVELGVNFKTGIAIDEIRIENGITTGLVAQGEFFDADIVLSGADYHHTEKLLPPEYRQYSEKYWDKRVLAPSSLLFYIGFDTKLPNVEHHTLFFDTDFDIHAQAIYDNPAWPEQPLFYGSFPSKTDTAFAPEGCEAATFLIPLAPDLEDTPKLRERYFHKIMDRFEDLTDFKARDHIIFKKSFCVNDFKSEYNSYKGNAYGLANILTQTAFLRPKIQSGKVSNLFFTGQLTVPGPGVPPSLISGKIASELIQKSSA